MLYQVMPFTAFTPALPVYVIPGRPIPLQRARFSSGRVYDSQKIEKIHTGLYLKQQYGLQKPLGGPLKFIITFYFKPPQRNKKLLGTFHFCKPDTDNLVKYYSDVAQGILFTNDSQIAQIVATKIYDENERTEFILEQLK